MNQNKKANKKKAKQIRKQLKKIATTLRSEDMIKTVWTDDPALAAMLVTSNPKPENDTVDQVDPVELSEEAIIGNGFVDIDDTVIDHWNKRIIEAEDEDVEYVEIDFTMMDPWNKAIMVAMEAQRKTLEALEAEKEVTAASIARKYLPEPDNDAGPYVYKGATIKYGFKEPKPEHTPEYWIDKGYYVRKHAVYNTEDPAEIDAIVRAEMASDKIVNTLQNADQEYAWPLTIAFIESIVGKGWGPVED